MEAYAKKIIETFQRSNKAQKLELLNELSRHKTPEMISFLVNTLGDEH